MKFHQRWFLPFLLKPRYYIEVSDEWVTHMEWGKTACRFSLEKTTATCNYEGKGLSKFLFGSADVLLKEESRSEHPVPNVFHGDALRNHIDQKREAQKREAEKARALLPPSGTVFSRNVLRMPALSAVFDRALWIQHTDPRLHPYWYIKYGQWVNRGDKLCSFPVKTARGLFSRSRGIPIISPVSGLLLCGFQIFNGEPWSAILLPEHEPTPLSPSDVFDPLCEACWQHRAHIFQEPEELHGYKGYLDENLKETFRAQREDAEYVIGDLSDTKLMGGTNYHDYIVELRTMYPDLASYLNPLLEKVIAPDTAEGPHSDSDFQGSTKGEPPHETQEANADPYRGDRFSRIALRVEQARVRWKLPEDFTASDVSKKVPNSHEDYALLIAAAA